MPKTSDYVIRDCGRAGWLILMYDKEGTELKRSWDFYETWEEAGEALSNWMYANKEGIE